MCTVLLPPDVNPIAVNTIYHIQLHPSSDKTVTAVKCVRIPYRRALAIDYPQVQKVQKVVYPQLRRSPDDVRVSPSGYSRNKT
jgi:hypothetical protein